MIRIEDKWVCNVVVVSKLWNIECLIDDEVTPLDRIVMHVIFFCDLRYHYADQLFSHKYSYLFFYL